MARKNGFYRLYGKRGLDIIFSFFALVLLSPLLLILSLLVLIFHGSPVLFSQRRPGLNEEIFKLYKFRSMTDKRDEEGQLLATNLRITRFGNLLRKSSLDELPELLNILKGDMSFVGPRPLLEKYLPYYEEEERRRHDVRPGLTGYSQISGRNTLTWRERFELDVEYVEKLSFSLDVKIIIKTFLMVLKRSDIGDMSRVAQDEYGSYIEYNGRRFRPFDQERLYERDMRNKGLGNENN